MEFAPLINYIRQYYSDRYSLQVINLRNITSGWETVIISLDLNWQSNGESHDQGIIARIFPGKGATAKALAEFSKMKQLYNLGYPVPEVYLVEKDADVIGNPFILMERIDGLLLDEKLGASDFEYKRWMEIFCRLFVNLHQLDWTSFVTDSEKQSLSGTRGLVFSRLTRYKIALKEYQKKELTPIYEWLMKRVDGISSVTPSITHGDYHPFNILLDSSDKPYVIDWGASSIDDYRKDLAWTLLLSGTFGSMKLREDILKNYEKAAQKPVEQIEFFEVTAILRRLFDISTSLSLGADELGMRPDAVEMIKSRVDHIKGVRDRLEDLTGIIIPKIDLLVDELLR
ncbi:MAG: phosphotransferase family protein [Candidatus Odinarchaeota archaeon]